MHFAACVHFARCSTDSKVLGPEAAAGLGSCDAQSALKHNVLQAGEGQAQAYPVLGLWARSGAVEATIESSVQHQGGPRAHANDCSRTVDRY